MSTTDDKARHAKAGAARAAALDDRAARYVSALEVERAGYVTRGLEGRVAQVDEQIKFWRSQGVDGAATDEQEPDGTGGEQEPDGTGGEQEPDGTGGEQEPDGTGGEQEPDGTGGEQEPDGTEKPSRGRGSAKSQAG